MDRCALSKNIVLWEDSELLGQKVLAAGTGRPRFAACLQAVWHSARPHATDHVQCFSHVVGAGAGRIDPALSCFDSLIELQAEFQRYHILSYQPRADFTDNNECKTTPSENLYTANVSLTPVFSLLWRHLQKHWATVECSGRILSVISSRDEIPVNTIGFTPSCTHRGQSTQTAF